MGLRLRQSNQPNLGLADLISLQPVDIIHNSGGIAFGDAGAIRWRAFDSRSIYIVARALASSGHARLENQWLGARWFDPIS